MLQFGTDGFLYISVSDGYQVDDAQDLSDLKGGLLRLDTRNASEKAPYDIPPDNPFANNNEGVGDDNFRRALKHDGELNPPDTHGIERIEILGPNDETSAGLPTPHPGIWETEPKESVDLDLYFQASGWIPIDFNDETKENLLPIGSTFRLPLSTGGSTTHTVTEWTGPNTIKFTPSGTADNTLVQNESIEFTKRDYYSLN